MVRFILACGLVAFMSGSLTLPVGGQEQKEIVGEWHIQKGSLSSFSLVEFTSDGKLKITTVPENKHALPLIWKYRVDGTALETKTNYGPKELEHKLTISKATAEELVLRDSKRHETTLRKGKSPPRSEEEWKAADSKGNYKFHVKNDTADAPGVWIIMDTNRERHRINPGATVIFENANKLDNPTFRVYKVRGDGEPGDLLYTDTFFANGNPFSWSRDLVWNGSKLTDKN